MIIQGEDYKKEFIEILKQLEYYNKNYEKQNFKAKFTKKHKIKSNN